MRAMPHSASRLSPIRHFLHTDPDKQTGDDEEARALAEKRFKEVNEAYTLLSDPAKRERYDRTGRTDDDNDDDNDLSTARKRGAAAGPPVYMSVDELISLSFGTRRRRYAILSEEPLLLLLIQILPALVLLFTSVAKPAPTPAAYAGIDAPFRMAPDELYSHPRHTAAKNVAYYVRADFDLIAAEKSARGTVEAAVESVDCEARRRDCDAQLRQKQLHINAARRTPKGAERDAKVASAEARPTPACVTLQAIYREERSASQAFKANPEPPGGRWKPGQAWITIQASPDGGSSPVGSMAAAA